jgi:hypothetical protein
VALERATRGKKKKKNPKTKSKGRWVSIKDKEYKIK